MNRFFTLIVTGIMLITMSSFFNNGVSIKMEMPNVIEAGTEITVNVTINKGKLTGFARFQQDLPYGFTAIAGNSANADFSFEDQKVRLIWLRVPDAEEITVSYTIVANERLKGSINLNGHFSYIENNERKSVDLQPQMLAIAPSPNVDQDMIVDAQEWAKRAKIPATTTKASRVVCLRQNPVWMQDGNVFLVTLLVNKEAIQKYAKIEEVIPKGYTAVDVDAKGGMFSFSGQLAKFFWMDLPAEPYFTVTYKLIPNEGTNINETAMQIAGTFSYTLGDNTMSVDVIERKEVLAGLNQNQVNNILNSVIIGEPILIASTTEKTSPGKKPTAPTVVVSSHSDRPVAVSGSKSENNSLTPESGIYYRVQIAAGHQPLNGQRYFRKYKLERSVERELHDGWFKYSIGSFAEYKAARDYRVHLSNTTTLNDAFVAAYNNGKRITVQEALMALNQKWYK